MGKKEFLTVTQGAREKRTVRINQTRGVWMVLYTDRQKHGRYAAAQFDANDHSKEQVEAWVRQQPKLSLEGQ